METGLAEPFCDFWRKIMHIDINNVFALVLLFTSVGVFSFWAGYYAPKPMSLGTAPNDEKANALREAEIVLAVVYAGLFFGAVMGDESIKFLSVFMMKFFWYIIAYVIVVFLATIALQRFRKSG